MYVRMYIRMYVRTLDIHMHMYIIRTRASFRGRQGRGSWKESPEHRNA